MAGVRRRWPLDMTLDIIENNSYANNMSNYCEMSLLVNIVPHSGLKVTQVIYIEDLSDWARFWHPWNRLIYLSHVYHESYSHAFSISHSIKTANAKRNCCMIMKFTLVNCLNSHLLLSSSSCIDNEMWLAPITSASRVPPNVYCHINALYSKDTKMIKT